MQGYRCYRLQVVLNEFTGPLVLEGKVAMLVFILLFWLPIFIVLSFLMGVGM